PLNAVLVEGPQHGAVTLNADGSFTYTPAADYHGPDGFSYVARDPTDAQSLVAAVSLSVTPVNDGPVAADDAYTAPGDGTLPASPTRNVLANDADVDGPALTATLVDGSGPQHGTLALNANGTFTFTPVPGYLGPDGFRYVVSDGSLSDEGVVSLTVAEASVFASNDAYATDEDTPLVVAAGAGVLANDASLVGAPLSAVLIMEPTHGSVALNADGSFTYTPAPNYFGPDSFSYQATDGTRDATADVMLAVTAVNDAPVLASLGDPVEVDEGDLIELLASATDADGDALTFRLLAPPANARIDPTTGAFSWRPDDTHGFAVRTLVVEVSDGELTGTGSLAVTVHEVIEGGPGRDSITVNQAGGIVTAVVNGRTTRYGALPKLTVRGLEGNDVITLRGLTIPTVIVEAGAGNDRVNALAVRSTRLDIDGGDGNDTLWGGRGADTIRAGGGDDWVFAGAGDDVVDGGDGNDRLAGEAGNDTVSGGSGRDTIVGGAGDDVLDGGDDEDQLQGGIGDDTLRGGAADDRLLGDAGNDRLEGGDGDDTLVGGAGVNTLIGGPGADTIIARGFDTVIQDDPTLPASQPVQAGSTPQIEWTAAWSPAAAEDTPLTAAFAARVPANDLDVEGTPPAVPLVSTPIGGSGADPAGARVLDTVVPDEPASAAIERVRHQSTRRTDRAATSSRTATGSGRTIPGVLGPFTLMSRIDPTLAPRLIDWGSNA
ncbi:MAG: tandem-95 repeat protein, partial [Candidatus Rokubacteria bacterium]|nr:tandem-95 repeat protein [Candidatus Rokubacteria bacterium]